MPLSSRSVIVDTKKMDRVLEINSDAMTIAVQAGAVRSDFDRALEKAGFWFPFDPPSHPVSTIGGFISTAAAGWWMPKYGYMGDLVLALEVVLPDGKVLRTRPVMKHSVGPNLNSLFVGAGGTLGIITEATLKTYPLPQSRRTRVFTFPTFKAAYRAAYAINRADLNPYVLRVGDDGHSRVYLGRALGESRLEGASVIFGFDGLYEIVEAEDRIALSIATERGGHDWGLEMGGRFWDTRLNFWKQRKSPKATTNVITTAATFDRIEPLYEAVRALYDRHGIHFSIHIPHFTGKGASLYCIFRHTVDEAGLALSRRVWQEAIPMIQKLGGTLEHHHEIGLHLAPWVEAELGAGLDVLRRIKRSLDPAGIMNPGKLAL
jgi:alkyldihydroxyacetonephosphate synthase